MIEEVWVNGPRLVPEVPVFAVMFFSALLFVQLKTGNAFPIELMLHQLIRCVCSFPWTRALVVPAAQKGSEPKSFIIGHDVVLI